MNKPVPMLKRAAVCACIVVVAWPHANAKEMTGWKVVYSGTQSESIVCHDPDIDQLSSEVVCYGPDRMRDPIEAATQMVGLTTLLFSAIMIGIFIAYKLGRVRRDGLYADQTTNLMIAWSFLSILMFAAGLLELS